MSKALQKELYKACDPQQALEPDDIRNIDLDAWRPGEPPLRGVDWVARMAREFELADGPLLRLFSGLPGSGKSTELRRLRARLQQDPGANLLTVLVDAEDLLDLRVPIDIPELLLVMFHEAERTLLELEETKPGQATQEGFFARFLGLVERAHAEPSKLEINVGFPGASTRTLFDLKENPALRERVRRVVQGNRALFAREIQEAFENLQRRAISKGRTGLVLLVDSLEKLRGMSDNFEAVLKSAEQLFAGGAPYLQLPVHTLYTVPPALVLRLYEDVKSLPMIKLRTPEGTVFDSGFAAAFQLVLRRVNQDQLNEIFGPVEAEARIRELISASGGYPREIVRLLRASITARSFPIAEGEFQSILQETGDAYRRVALGHGFLALDILARVYVTKRLIVNRDERELVDHLVANNLILRYQNTNDWVDIHPSLLRIDQLAKAIEKQRIAHTTPP